MQTKITHELLVVSDIHILDKDDKNAKLLLEFLSSIDTEKVRYLVLLGDIFDFCLGASTYFHKKFAEVGKELSRISTGNVNVFFLEGNHEFLISRMPWVGVKFVNKKTLKLSLHNGKSVSFIHGDYIGATWHYAAYSKLIRSRLSEFFACKIPQKWLDSLALGISGKSRERSYSKELDSEALKTKILEWVHHEKSDYGIFGHFHIPFDFSDEEGSQRALCLESWEKPNFLSYDSGHFYRNYFQNNGIQSILQKPQ